MKKLYLLLIGIILLVFALIFRSCKDREIEEQSNILTKSERNSSVSDHTNQQEVQKNRVNKEEEIKLWNKLFKSPINFWVKVVDEEGNPIEGATVNVNIVKDPKWGGRDNEDVELKTDIKGMAELLNRKGALIHVKARAKGYIELRNSNSKDLSRSMIMYSQTENNPLIPTKENPTVLKLRKELSKANLVTFKTKKIPIGSNGEERIITAQLEDNSGAVTMKVKCWSEAPLPFNYDPYPWKAEICVEGGQLKGMPDEYGYEAPENEYEEILYVDMKPSDKHWKRSLGGFNGYYWLKLSDGRYGKISLKLNTGRKHDFRFEGFLNTDGTRALDVKF